MKFLVFSLFLAVSAITFSQTIISGEVRDAQSQLPLEYVQIRLLSKKDSSLVTGTTTNDAGKFMLEDAPKGSYLIRVSYTGYELYFIDDINIDVQPTIQLGKIMLSEVKSSELDDIVIEAKLDVLKAGIDKKVYNVESDIAARGAGADEVLSNIPSVTLDEEGRVTMRGDGAVTILINGQPSSMSGAGGNLLSSIPANQIERIEVVTNPSAKYDPDGTSGIINIILKKNKIRGFNGQVSATGALPGHDHKLNAVLSFRNEKWNVFGSYGFDYMEGYRNNYSEIKRKSSVDTMSIIQNRQGGDFRRGHVARVGFDYYINTKNTIGFSANGQLSDRNRTGIQTNDQSFNQVTSGQWNRNSEEPTERRGLDFNIYSNHTLKNENQKLSTSFTNTYSGNNESGFFEQDTLMFQGVQDLWNPTYLRQFSKTNNNNFIGQVDFEHLLPKKKLRYEVGVKSIVRNEKLDGQSDRYNYSVGDYVNDNFAYYDYTYNEQVHSAYATMGQELNKFKYQVGFRGEYAIQSPNLLSQNIAVKKEYFNLYPSAHLRYAFTDKNEISLSYSRRVNRPSSFDLNPFTNYADPYNLRTGNPYLNPEYINSFDLGYTHQLKKWSFTTNGYYRETRDAITRVKKFTSENTSTVTMENVAKSQVTGLELVVQVRPTSWWRNTLSFDGSYIVFTNTADANSNFNNQGFNWSIKYSGAVDFWKKTATVQVNVNHSAPRITAQGKVYPWRFVDISVSKSFLKKNLIVSMKLADVFNTKGFKMIVDQPMIYQFSNFDFQTRRVYLTLTYKFGKFEVSKKALPKMEGEGGGDF